ncbi:MAG: rRNA maturation RNase YbeY [Saprospiraceae bacterium]|nr:rRNA maturation RNase YbeY [Saprospiraceae bacterium]
MPPASNIQFDFQCETFEIPERKWKEWINKMIKLHGKKPGNINIIFCDDLYLLNMNKQFLGHDYFTDIITFPLANDKIEGELYISIDRVIDNAPKFNQDVEQEKLRVIIHGILHLLGFKDKTKAEQKQMRELEEEAVNLYNNALVPKDNYFDWVYGVVQTIPRGRVSTYGAIADYLSLGSARMVGWALNQLKGHVSNIPAHRVVNVKGELSGRMMFGEAGERMAKLLRKEGVKVVDHKVTPMEDFFWHPEEG